MHQIAADIPSYKVANQHRWSQVLHQDWLSLLMSEVGIPLCMGTHHTWNRCTSPTPCKITSTGGDEKKMPQEKDGKAVTPQPISKVPWGGKMGSYSLDHGCPPGHPPRVGEDHGQSDLAVDIRRNTYIRQRDNVYTCWCWQIVNPKRKATIHWTGSRQARQIKIRGGVKQVGNPHVWVRDKAVYHSDAECFPLSWGTYLIVEEWHCTQGRTKSDSTAKAQGCAPI